MISTISLGICSAIVLVVANLLYPTIPLSFIKAPFIFGILFSQYNAWLDFIEESIGYVALAQWTLTEKARGRQDAMISGIKKENLPPLTPPSTDGIRKNAGLVILSVFIAITLYLL
jgi:hypothetical protein